MADISIVIGILTQLTTGGAPWGATLFGQTKEKGGGESLPSSDPTAH